MNLSPSTNQMGKAVIRRATRLLARIYRTHGDSTICTGTSGSGAPTTGATNFTSIHQRVTLKISTIQTCCAVHFISLIRKVIIQHTDNVFALRIAEKLREFFAANLSAVKRNNECFLYGISFNMVFFHFCSPFQNNTEYQYI